MKYLVVAFLAFLSASLPARAVELKGKGIDINTTRVIKICDAIDPAMFDSVRTQALSTEAEPGDRVVILQSPGGSVEVGEAILHGLMYERAAGHRIVCVVEGYAHSMAFNILSYCDVRLATAGSFMVMHKVALGELPEGQRLTAVLFRQLAAELDMTDAPYKEQNSRALGLSSEDYDLYADQQHAWTVQQLLERGYLDGVVTLKGDFCK